MEVTFALCVIVVGACVVFICRHLTRNFNYWKHKGVPFLRPIILFGNAFKVVVLKQSLGQLAQDVYDHEDSRCTGFFVFDQPFLLIRNPDLIKDVLIRDFEYFDNRTVIENRRDDEIGTNLLFVIKNPAWKSVRTKLTPVFTTGKIKNMLNLMLESSENMVVFINKMVSINYIRVESREICMKYTTDVISSCAFGINSKSFSHEDTEFRDAARRFFTFNISRSIQMASYFIAPCLVKLFRMKLMESKSAEFMRSVFWKHMHQRTTINTKRGDLIDILLQMQETSNDKLDGEVLVAQALQFFIAGFETTGSTISFTLYELAANKIIQKRLRDEINKILKIHGTISYEAIMDMKYLDNVVSETLRKYPPLTFLDRRCSKAYTIPDSNVTIQEGIPIYISLLGLHMDPAHFPEPEKFDPDRFSEENRSSIKPFTYMPFGEGPRNCIGARFGLLSAKSAIIAVIANFEVELDSKTPYPITLDPKSGFLIAPKGGVLYLRYKKCTPEAI